MLHLIFHNTPLFADTEDDDWILGHPYIFINEIMPQMDNVSCGPIVAGAIAFLLGVASNDMLTILRQGDWEALRAILYGILQPHTIRADN